VGAVLAHVVAAGVAALDALRDPVLAPLEVSSATTSASKAFSAMRALRRAGELGRALAAAMNLGVGGAYREPVWRRRPRCRRVALDRVAHLRLVRREALEQGLVLDLRAQRAMTLPWMSRNTRDDAAETSTMRASSW
jgi:hypothetical protein